MENLHFFFFNDTATTEIYTLSLHDALPISVSARRPRSWDGARHRREGHGRSAVHAGRAGAGGGTGAAVPGGARDRRAGLGLRSRSAPDHARRPDAPSVHFDDLEYGAFHRHLVAL